MLFMILDQLYHHSYTMDDAN